MNTIVVPRRTLLTGGLAATSLIALSACGASRNPTAGGSGNRGAKKTIRFGYTAVATNPVAEGFVKFADLVSTRSNGEMAVKTFGANELGSDQQLTQSAQSGALQMGDSSNNNLDQFTSKMMVLELPYLITSRDVYRKVWESDAGAEIMKSFEDDLGLKIIMVMDAGGWRGIEGSTIYHSPADLKGAKLRAANTPIEVATFRRWGADPVPMAYNQVYTALQQHTVDGEILQPLWFYSDKHYEVAKAVSDIHYIMLSHIAMMNLKYYRSLSKDQQAVIDQAGKDAEDYEWDIAGKAATDARQKLKAMPGRQWYTPSGAALANWKDSSQPIWDQFSGKIGKSLISKIASM